MSAHGCRSQITSRTYMADNGMLLCQCMGMMITWKYGVEEVEEEHDGEQRGQGQGHNDADEDDGGDELQHAAQEEGRKVRQVLVRVHGVLGQAVDDAPQRCGVEERHGRPARRILCLSVCTM